MSPAIIALIIVAIVAVLVVGFALARPLMQRQRLRMRYGPEYDHAVRQQGGHAGAVRELLAREQRHKELNLRPLDPARRDHYEAEWMAVQERFVDTPGGAAQEADRLITSIMTDQGYPDEGYDQRLADLSVEHSRATDRYRKAHDIAAKSADNAASTEDLRQALVHYRALFEELLGVRKGSLDTTARGGGRHAKTERPAPAVEDRAAPADGAGRTATEDDGHRSPAQSETPAQDETPVRDETPAQDKRPATEAEAPTSDKAAGRKR